MYQDFSWLTSLNKMFHNASAVASRPMCLFIYSSITGQHWVLQEPNAIERITQSHSVEHKMYIVIKHWINPIHSLNPISCNSILEDRWESLNAWQTGQMDWKQLHNAESRLLQNHLRHQNQRGLTSHRGGLQERTRQALGKPKRKPGSVLWHWGNKTDALGEAESVDQGSPLLGRSVVTLGGLCPVLGPH